MHSEIHYHSTYMARSAIELLDLPDEVVLIILKKLDCVHMLYSLEGTNKRLDTMVVSKSHTNVLDLVSIIDDTNACLMLDTILTRFCSYILPRICHNVQSLILEEAHVKRVILACEYSNLCNLSIVNFQADFARRYLTGMNIT